MTIDCVFTLMEQFQVAHAKIISAFQENPKISKNDFIKMLPEHLKTNALLSFLKQDHKDDYIEHAMYVKFLSYQTYVKNFTNFDYLVEIGVLKTDEHGIIILNDKQKFAGAGQFRKNAYFIWILYDMMRKNPIMNAVLQFIKFELEVKIELGTKLPQESKRPDAIINGVGIYLDEKHSVS